MFFSSVVGFSMSACSVRVDVTESVVKLLRIWCRCAVLPLVGLSHHSAGRWRPWAYHATNHTNFIYQPIFQIMLQNIQQ